MYDAHLSKWLSVGWPLEQFLIIKFEDLFEERGASNVYGRILDFVGLQAHNLSSTTPSNRRSVVPYEVLPYAYDDMVEVVRDDVKARPKDGWVGASAGPTSGRRSARNVSATAFVGWI